MVGLTPAGARWCRGPQIEPRKRRSEFFLADQPPPAGLEIAQ